MSLLLLKFILAHILGDFVLQPSRWVQQKEEGKHRSRFLYLHVLIHAAVLALLLWFDLRYWLGFTLVVLSHLVIDLIKARLSHRTNTRLLFFADQTAHLMVIVGSVNLYKPIDWNIDKINSPQTYLLIIALLSVTFVSAVIMKVVIAHWELEEDTQDDSLKNAGRYIGMLERVFVFAFIVLNQWQVIGFLLAAKSVFRFGDLSKSRDRKLTEYILIGTLISFGLAILVGLGYGYLVREAR